MYSLSTGGQNIFFQIAILKPMILVGDMKSNDLSSVPLTLLGWKKCSKITRRRRYLARNFILMASITRSCEDTDVN